MTVLAQVRRAAECVCDSIGQKWARCFTPQPGPFEAQPLERRVLLSSSGLTAAVSGPGEITEGSAYVLSLTAASTASDYTLTGWTIDYGDNYGQSTLDGSATSDTYYYSGPDSGRTITATATDIEDGSTYSDTASWVVQVDLATPTPALANDYGAIDRGDTFVLDGSFDDPGGELPTAWVIDWGDGSAATYAGSASDVLGDGGIGGPADATHVYSQDGTYTVTGSAIDDYGTYSAASATVEVDEPVPTFSIGGDDTFVKDQPYVLSATFGDSAGDTPTADVIAWGDGQRSTYDGSAADFTHTYAGGYDASYAITATVTTDFGTYTNETSVSEAPATLSLSGGTEISAGETFTLIDTFTDPNGNTLQNYFVDWGDGTSYWNSGDPASATHVYDQPPDGGGAYTILADATTNDGDFYAPAAQVTVDGATPTLVLSGDSTVTEGSAFILFETFTDPDGKTPYDWTIDWGDQGGSFFYNGGLWDLTHTYADAGTYDISATARCADGAFGVSTTVGVVDATPTFTLRGGFSGYEGDRQTELVTFADPGGPTPTQWTMDWGDGHRDTYGTNPDYHGTFTHVYDDQGTYTETATVATDDGTFTAVAQNSNTIWPDNPSVWVDAYYYLSGGEPFPVRAYFQDSGGHEATGYTVDWGDGTTQTYADEQFSHVYGFDPRPAPTATNYYQYTITATDAYGDCTISGGVQVAPVGSGAASLSAPQTAVEATTVSTTCSFSDAEQVSPMTPGPANWVVYWGDESHDAPDYSSGVAAHVYAEAGTYVQTLAVAYWETNDTYGAPHAVYADTFSTITITDATPTITPTSGAGTATAGIAFGFYLGYTDPGSRDTPSRWTIAWGDGTGDSSTGTYYQHTYWAGGDETVTATAHGDDGDFATSWVVSVQGDSPTIGLTASPYQGAYESGQGSDNFTLTRTGGNAYVPLVVSYTLSGDEGPGEYVVTDPVTGLTLTGTATLPAGDWSEALVVTPLQDTKVDWTETIDATLTASGDYAIDPDAATASMEVVDDNLGVYLGNGSDNLILQGSSDGKSSLVPLVMSFPSDIEDGATLTLADNQPSEADVWLTSSPGDDDQPILGVVDDSTVSSKTWVYGTDPLPPTTLWVGGTGGSASVNDIYFTLDDSDAGATSPPASPTSNSATSNRATNVAVQIIMVNDPNNSGNSFKNIAGNTTPIPWLVGQMEWLKAQVTGPAAFIAHPKYSWNVPGNVLRAMSVKSPVGPVSLTADDGGYGAFYEDEHPLHTGTSLANLKFFWVNVPTANPATITLTVSNTGPESPHPISTVFSIQSPSITANAAAHGAVAINVPISGTPTEAGLGFSPLNAAIDVGVKVQQPSGFAAGSWTFLQLVNSTDEYDHWENDGTNDKYLWSNNGIWALDGPGFPISASLGLIKDPSNNYNSVRTNPLATADHAYDWMDNAQTPLVSLDKNGNIIGDLGIYGVVPATEFFGVIRSDQYHLYVMYLALGTDSQWVPLKVMNWSWAVEAKDSSKQGTAWQTVSHTDPTDTGWTAATSEPAWTVSWAAGKYRKQ